MFVIVFIEFPDTIPQSPFEDFCFNVWAVASWPLSVVWLRSQEDPPFIVIILLTIASGLFWAFIVDLLLAVKRHMSPNTAHLTTTGQSAWLSLRSSGHIMLMRKVLFTILWTFEFFLAGFGVLGIFFIVMAYLPDHLSEAIFSDDRRVRLIVDWLFPIGLPVLALILGIFGKLPGTRSGKDLVQV
jgi:hypothetical protein